jgi:hypothetical protein
MVAHDYARPSFVVRQSETIRLLGDSQWTRGGEFYYAVASGSGYMFDWFIGIHFHGDYVVSSTLFSNDRGADPGK